MRRHRLLAAVAGALLLTACGSATTGSTAGTVAVTTTLAITSSSAATTAPPPTTAAEDWRLAALDQARAAYGAPGAVAFLFLGDKQWAGAVGAADLEGTPAAASMRFRAGSITKTIVAAVVLDLVERGLVDLDRPTEEILPGVLRPDQPVTVRQLLDHTSGVFDWGNEGDPATDVTALTDPGLRAEAAALLAAYLTEEPVQVPDRILVALAETHPRYFAAGTGWHYSNPNYQVAGMVVEAVTGRPLASVLQETIAGPLGLASFSLAPADESSPELRGYALLSPDRHEPVAHPEDGELFDFTDDLSLFGNGGNGGLLTTAEDLARFFRELLAGRVLAPGLLEDMRQASAPARSLGIDYGLGLFAIELPCGRFYGHDGSVNGTASIALADEDGGRV
ncbi:MAG: beta-lactamase family protein, partial [Acidimicrobiia bacterium]|nr:beta-lactamase family protein [Acidimicrobiia bacterium]